MKVLKILGGSELISNSLLVFLKLNIKLKYGFYFFRGNSMKRTAAAIHNPTVKVSVPVRPDSLAFELLDDYKKDDVVSDPIHPDEITQELEALSKYDFLKKTIIVVQFHEIFLLLNFFK